MNLLLLNERLGISLFFLLLAGWTMSCTGENVSVKSDSGDCKIRDWGKIKSSILSFRSSECLERTLTCGDSSVYYYSKDESRKMEDRLKRIKKLEENVDGNIEFLNVFSSEECLGEGESGSGWILKYTTGQYSVIGRMVTSE